MLMVKSTSSKLLKVLGGLIVLLGASLHFSAIAESSFLDDYFSHRMEGEYLAARQALISYIERQDEEALWEDELERASFYFDLAEYALDWYSKGMSGLKTDQNPPAFTHLQLRWAMERRRLNVIRQDAHGFLETGKSFGPADAWFAWRFLRKLN